MTTTKHSMNRTNSAIVPGTTPAYVGIDLAKNSVHVHGVDGSGRTCIDRKMRPGKLKEYLANLEPCVVGLEACGRAHQWGRDVLAMGHEAKLMAPQFVKPYVQSNKNDRADAAAICEAVQRPNMRFVGIKSADRQSQQAMHRVRSRAVGNRTAHVNEIRGLLAEYGIEIPKGRWKVRPAVAEILGNGGTADITLPPQFLDVLAELYDEMVHMDERMEKYDSMIGEIARQDEQARLLMTIPGVGPMTATALLAAMGDPGVFRNGREYAASLGLVPRQHSTGGKDRLLGISKRGDRYLRCLLIHGARVMVTQLSRKDKTDRRSQWLQGLLERRHRNVATVALANRMARTVWSILASGKPCEESHVPA